MKRGRIFVSSGIFSLDLERLRKFFGDDETATALTNRINNELSHLDPSSPFRSDK